ncbi:MAG: choice-of-anchor D domain-containing protein [Acidobacteria bacterium]|nr:choice-of-anchor D domain-containing protein [Acidobacteriota bacterium]
MNFCWLAIAFLGLCGIASGQTFQFRVQQGSLVAPVTEGSTVTLAADAVGRPVQATVTATYAGLPGAVISGVWIGGSSDFVLTYMPALPQSLASGQSFSFGIRFLPTAGARAIAQVYVQYTEATTPRFVILNLAGTAPEFTVGYILSTDNNFNPLSPGGQIAFPATSINASTTVTVVVSNRGYGTGFVNSVAVAGGSFQPAGLPALPAVLDSGRELRFGIVFSPSKAGSQSGTLSLVFTDRTFLVPITGTTAAPDFKLTYMFQTDGNVTTLDSGGRLVFPATRVNATASAVVALSNYGSGGGYVNSISLTGQNFQLSGVVPLPILVGPGREMRFGVAYSPNRLETSTGVLKVVFDDRTLVIDLSGTSTGPMFTYAVVSDTSASSFYARETVPVPETALRETSSLAVQIRNAGNADGTITAILVTGQGFQLSNLPILPAILSPNATVQFNLTFTPSQPGLSNGRLQIGADTFDLIASGKGPKLLYSYIGDAGSVAVQDGRTVLWGRVQVGQTSQVEFVVRNEGTGAATISSVAIVDARSAYRLVNIPEFPAAVAPGSELSFSLLFSPTALGDNVARLRVDSETFTLVGSGTPPPPLPAVELTGPAQALEPLQQPALGLTLASPYPLPLSGTLTLTVNSSSFSVDPAVQFATGGRSVAFTIPANTTKAQFPGGTDIRLQAGTVAGTINVTAAFATESGINVTPDSPPAISLQIPAAPPRVLDVQFDARTTNGFSIVVTGLSTTRSLTQLELDFASSSKYNVPTGRFTLNVESASSAWYRSAESQIYGSLFIARVPFTFQGPGGSLNLDQVFQSISATLTNEKGRSNSLSVTPQP